MIVRILLIILTGSVLSSCGLFKSTSKERHRSKVDSLYKETTVKIDTTVSTSTTVTHTKLNVPGSTTNIDWNISKNPTWIYQDNTQEVALAYDSLTNTVKGVAKVRDQLQDITSTTTTTTKNGVIETGTRETKVEKKEDDEHKNSTPDWKSYILGAIGLCIVVGFVWFLIKKK